MWLSHFSATPREPQNSAYAAVPSKYRRRTFSYASRSKTGELIASLLAAISGILLWPRLSLRSCGLLDSRGDLPARGLHRANLTPSPDLPRNTLRSSALQDCDRPLPP